MANTGYLVYLDDVLFPITPSNITTTIKNQNHTINLIDGREINILESAGLTEISFTVDIPQITKYPFAMYRHNEFKSVIYYTNKLEDLKVNKKPAKFKVIRRSPTGGNLYDTSLTVSVEDYTITDDAKNGFDVAISIKLKQYVEYKTKVLPVLSESENKVVRQTVKRSTTRTIPDTYVVKKDDTLWAICQKYLGDGTKFREVAKLNNISNPNLIYPNQIIRLK